MKSVTFYHDIEQDVNCEADVDACRDAVRRLLRVEAALGVKTTYNVVGALWVEQPDIVDWIRAESHEVAFHSYHHKLECPPAEFRAEIRRCREFQDAVEGYRSPRSRWNQDTLDGLVEHRFRWSAESDSAALPYWIRTGLVRLPIAGDDWPLHLGQLDTDEWVARFEELLHTRPYVAIGVHDCVVSLSLDDRISAWERCIELALSNGAVALPFGAATRLAGDPRH